MQIVVHPHEDGQIPEWSAVELQGDLESRTDESISGKIIGDLHFNEQGTPILIIGHHILYGKVQELDNPLIITEKETHDNSPSDDSYSQNPSFKIKAVIKQKLVFKTRPKPIIANVPKKV